MNLNLITVIISALFCGFLALMLQKFPRLQNKIFFITLGISGMAAVYIGLIPLITHEIISYQCASTLANISWQLKLDPLAGFFLAIVGMIVISVACYGPGYVNSYKNCSHGSLTGMYFFTGFFISSMYLVLVAYDAITFILAWELMSIASYFLVIYHHEQTTNRQAALIYLLMAAVSGFLILIAFGLLIRFTDNMGFSMWQKTLLPASTTNLAFLFAFLGFGMKAGIVPMHVWLPKAHPAAPAHISALMSGVMLKVAVYGFIRFAFDILHNVHWQWGVLTLAAGVISAIFGVLYAIMQHDIKKLLAYHSIENIGIIFSALGLALIFINTNHPFCAALGLTAALYHCLNHALFKSLLFLGAGVVVTQSGERDLEHLGGLIKKMPYTAWCFLIGCISISALPPFNGFISEWLLLQTALQSSVLKSEIMRTLIPLAAVVIVLTSALATACFAKVYGVAFLGRPRSATLEHAQDPSFEMQFAMMSLAFLCFLFGILPTVVIRLLQKVTEQLVASELPQTNWWLLTAGETSSYNPLLIVISVVLVALTSYYLVRFFYTQTKIRITQAWDCGYGTLNQRTQYTSTAFAMPIRRVFHHLLLSQEKIDRLEGKISYSLKVTDVMVRYFYSPLGDFSSLLAKNFAKLQGGKVRVYLIYMFLTLIFLLWIIA